LKSCLSWLIEPAFKDCSAEVMLFIRNPSVMKFKTLRLLIPRSNRSRATRVERVRRGKAKAREVKMKVKCISITEGDRVSQAWTDLDLYESRRRYTARTWRFIGRIYESRDRANRRSVPIRIVTRQSHFRKIPRDLRRLDCLRCRKQCRCTGYRP
jgi:hypothetical protein